MYVPYGGDIRYMEEITRKSGETLINAISRTIKKLKKLRLPLEGIQSLTRKWKLNAS